MMESAVTKSSESVTLDLLTYEDLEAMWDKKLGSSNRKGGLSPGGKPQAKRYLILTYNVEFDRIHYPLALPYCGRPDPIILQDTIRKLKAELDMTKKQVRNDYGFSTSEGFFWANLKHSPLAFQMLKKKLSPLCHSTVYLTSLI